MLAPFEARSRGFPPLWSTAAASLVVACGAVRGPPVDLVAAGGPGGPTTENRSMRLARPGRFDVTTTFVGHRYDTVLFDISIHNRSVRDLQVDPLDFRLSAGNGGRDEVFATDPELIIAQLDALAKGGASAHAKSSAARALVALVHVVAAATEKSPPRRARNFAEVNRIASEQQAASVGLSGRLAQLRSEREVVELEFLHHTVLAPQQTVSGFVAFETPHNPRTVTVTVHLEREDLPFSFDNRMPPPRRRLR